MFDGGGEAENLVPVGENLFGVHRPTNERGKGWIDAGFLDCEEARVVDVPNSRRKSESQGMAGRENGVNESGGIGAVLCGLKLWIGLSARFKKGNCCQRQEDEGFLCCSGLVEQSDDSCPGLLSRESGDAGYFTTPFGQDELLGALDILGEWVHLLKTPGEVAQSLAGHFESFAL